MQLLREFYSLCPDNRCSLPHLTEQEQIEVKTGKSVFLTGLFQRADIKNGNGRIYPKNVLEREIANYQKLIRESRAYGTLGHEDESEVSLKETSHMVIKLWWEGDSVMGKLKLFSTPSGKIAQTIVMEGGQLGISSRALGSLSESRTGDQIVGEDLQIISFDLVSLESTPGAVLHLSESQHYQLPEIVKADRINRALNQLCARL